MDIAIVGATGNVGRKTLEVLEKKDLSIDNLYLLASSKSVGKKINFKGADHDIHDLESFDFSKVKICFFVHTLLSFLQQFASDNRLFPRTQLLGRNNPSSLFLNKTSFTAHHNCFCT